MAEKRQMSGSIHFNWRKPKATRSRGCILRIRKNSKGRLSMLITNALLSDLDIEKKEVGNGSQEIKFIISTEYDPPVIAFPKEPSEYSYIAKGYNGGSPSLSNSDLCTVLWKKFVGEEDKVKTLDISLKKNIHSESLGAMIYGMYITSIAE